jgi:hypothetical protein
LQEMRQESPAARAGEAILKKWRVSPSRTGMCDE